MIEMNGQAEMVKYGGRAILKKMRKRKHVNILNHQSNMFDQFISIKCIISFLAHIVQINPYVLMDEPLPVRFMMTLGLPGASVLPRPAGRR